jgi:hypothetical protein
MRYEERVLARVATDQLTKDEAREELAQFAVLSALDLDEFLGRC